MNENFIWDNLTAFSQSNCQNRFIEVDGKISQINKTILKVMFSLFKNYISKQRVMELVKMKHFTKFYVKNVYHISIYTEKHWNNLDV